MDKKVKIIIGILSVVVVISMSMIGLTIYNNLKDKEDNKVPVEENNNQNNYQEVENSKELQYVKGTIKNNEIIIDEDEGNIFDGVYQIVVIDNFKLNNKNYKLEISGNRIQIGEKKTYYYGYGRFYDQIARAYIYTYNDYILLRYVDDLEASAYALFSENMGLLEEFGPYYDPYYEPDISDFSSGKLILNDMLVDEENYKKVYKKTTYIDLTKDFNKTIKKEKEGILCEDFIKEDKYPDYCACFMGIGKQCA